MPARGGPARGGERDARPRGEEGCPPAREGRDACPRGGGRDPPSNGGRDSSDEGESYGETMGLTERKRVLRRDNASSGETMFAESLRD